jgi:tyrosyl-tRNA synthetase
MALGWLGMLTISHTVVPRVGLRAAPLVARARHFRVKASVAEPSPHAAADLKSEFLRTMRWRGYLQQATDLEGLDAKLCEGKPVVAYLGFDATASSLHVGSLLQIMLLRHYQRCGHKPLVLVGGGTTKVGDPSGKDASRQMLTEEQIASNIAGISSVFSKFLTFGDGPTDAALVNNDDWLAGLNYLEFLRDYGTKFTINRMLTFESVKQRLERESPLSFLEFNYMILQAYDFLELHRRHGAELQFGGSDQWGNIISGVELGRRADGAALHGLTAPLLTTADGKKMGKTADGAVWLNEELLSPFEYWQFWRNTADSDVGKFLRIFTELGSDEIERLEALPGAEINAAKERLADEATAMLHGAERLGEIRATADALFAAGGALDEAASLPRVSLGAEELAAGVPVVELFLRLGFGKSKSEVRRLVSGGGARLNDVKIEDEKMVVGEQTFAGGTAIKLSSGKKKHGMVELR